MCGEPSQSDQTPGGAAVGLLYGLWREQMHGCYPCMLQLGARPTLLLQSAQDAQLAANLAAALLHCGPWPNFPRCWLPCGCSWPLGSAGQSKIALASGSCVLERLTLGGDGVLQLQLEEA